MRRLVAAVLVVAFGCSGAVQAGKVNWYAGTTGPEVSDRLGNPLVGAGPTTGSDFGGYLQLVQDVGLDGPDPLVLSEAGTGDGMSDGAGADIVLATGWIGAGILAGTPLPFNAWQDNAVGSGHFSVSTTMTPQQGDVYYVRVFDMPSPSYGAGAIPGTDAWYADITMGISTPVTSGEASSGIVDRPMIGPVPGDWQPVPEPGTLGLFALGMIALAARRRKC